MNEFEFRKNLKVNDVVCIEGRRGITKARVTGITKTLIKAFGMRFNKNTGHKTGSCYSFEATSITRWTEDHQKRLDQRYREKEVKETTKKLSDIKTTKISNYDLELLKTILNRSSTNDE
tara:strand:+ start:161 stop:517 length:357 start_codon:yes stop_codon:yes gene_type:complete